MICCTHWIGKTRFLQIVVIGIAQLMHIYIISSIFLFCIVTYTCASAFHSICEHVRNFNNEKSESSIANCDHQLQMWKRWIQLNSRTVSAINLCFGWNLLMSFCLLYISSICTTFWIVNSTMNGTFSLISKAMVDCSFLADNIIILSMICYPVDFLRSKV